MGNAHILQETRTKITIATTTSLCKLNEHNMTQGISAHISYNIHDCTALKKVASDDMTAHRY